MFVSGTEYVFVNLSVLRPKNCLLTIGMVAVVVVVVVVVVEWW